ncbi:MAG: PIN domain-containing protein [Candidatus Saccharimonadales bacterium]
MFKALTPNTGWIPINQYSRFREPSRRSTRKATAGYSPYCTKSEQLRLRRRSFVEELSVGLTVYPYADQTALLAGRIGGEQTAKGIIIPFIDLLIGATALSLGSSVLTLNMRHFRQIPGLNVVSLWK